MNMIYKPKTNINLMYDLEDINFKKNIPRDSIYIPKSNDIHLNKKNIINNLGTTDKILINNPNLINLTLKKDTIDNFLEKKK